MLKTLPLVLACACSSAYYSVWQKLGKEKRDLLVSHISRARDQQKETSETFKTLGALQKEKTSIERDTARLIKDMQAAIDEAGRFLETMKDDEG
jgi:Protein of unknown function (DUF2959)